MNLWAYLEIICYKQMASTVHFSVDAEVQLCVWGTHILDGVHVEAERALRFWVQELDTTFYWLRQFSQQFLLWNKLSLSFKYSIRIFGWSWTTIFVVLKGPLQTILFYNKWNLLSLIKITLYGDGRIEFSSVFQKVPAHLQKALQQSCAGKSRWTWKFYGHLVLTSVRFLRFVSWITGNEVCLGWWQVVIACPWCIWSWFSIIVSLGVQPALWLDYHCGLLQFGNIMFGVCSLLTMNIIISVEH